VSAGAAFAKSSRRETHFPKRSFIRRKKKRVEEEEEEDWAKREEDETKKAKRGFPRPAQIYVNAGRLAVRD